MGKIHLHYDTKSSELGHLTPIDLELNSLIIDLVYLAAVCYEGKRYGHSSEKMYIHDYGGEVVEVQFKNPLDIWALFKNLTQVPVDWVLQRAVFYEEEKAKRHAEAEILGVKVEHERQTTIEKKLKNISAAHDLRKKMIKDGVDPEEATKLIGGLLFDQRARLSSPNKSASL